MIKKIVIDCISAIIKILFWYNFILYTRHIKLNAILIKRFYNCRINFPYFNILYIIDIFIGLNLRSNINIIKNWKRFGQWHICIRIFHVLNTFKSILKKRKISFFIHVCKSKQTVIFIVICHYIYVCELSKFSSG